MANKQSSMSVINGVDHASMTLGIIIVLVWISSGQCIYIKKLDRENNFSKTDHPSFAINRRLKTSKPHHTTQRHTDASHLELHVLANDNEVQAHLVPLSDSMMANLSFIPCHRLIKFHIYPWQDISTLQFMRVTHRKGPWKLRSTITSPSIVTHIGQVAG